MAVTLGDEVLARYPRFSLYNSPYPAHDTGCAVDLYPGPEWDGPARAVVAPSPVAGEVVDTHTRRAPSKPYAPDHDHLILVRVDAEATPGFERDDGKDTALVARIMHVDPAVEAGDYVEAGDPLGTTVRAGFFAPWVGDHLHVGFRYEGQNHLRASGSLPLSVDVSLEAVEWDGTGTVVTADETYAVLDAPAHPAHDECFAGVAADGDGSLDARGVLDGGLRHYDGGGLLGAGGNDDSVSLLGQRVGVADGRTVDWDDVAVVANGTRITGLSLFLARDSGFGAKLVCPDVDFVVGESVTVELQPTDDPTILG
ncbi:hypothetical protein [Haloarchaeobius sp. DFWS5]|uniref:hypothetical protein n=1 Tax=Haloarchaeobius sp. DFWS5 TaxID=3446114 RepID=UPI003EBE2957